MLHAQALGWRAKKILIAGWALGFLCSRSCLAFAYNVLCVNILAFMRGRFGDGARVAEHGFLYMWDFGATKDTLRL